ncbi:nucleotidyl transferase [Candidatus Woesearchaeota archaeon CG11_big_fil_rev_8_21_14_0_20_43_8]|nr:MAG: nucleotidyl transferase [Candidatus Woesearchaeota archaeon CG11_big_fil_rev_8_21_14_0_20_43_8]
MKAIILAAGMGTRLGRYTENLPKCMLEFNGKTLIQRQVDTLRACGINDITIVKGYMPDKINISGVKYHVNSDFTNTNMVETLFCAEKEMDGDILVCYADIIYEKRIIETILSSNVNIGVTVDDDYWDYWKARNDNPEDDVESLVVDGDGKIIELGDTMCSREKAQMRYIGLIKFTKKGVDALRKVYYRNKLKFFDKDEPWLRSKSFKKAYMTCMLQAIINAGYHVDPIVVSRGWLEFDTIEDYERTKNWIKQNKLGQYFYL